MALVEPRALDAAREAAGRLDSGRIELLPGDIAERGLGLAREDYERLCAEVAQVFHLAALYNLAVPVETAQRVNVEGTGNVLDLCLAAERLERLAYVSTAYVAGRRTGLVYEHELVMGRPGRTSTSRRSSRPRYGCANSPTGCPARSCARRSWSATRATERRRSSTAPTTCSARSRAPRGPAGRSPSSVAPTRPSTSFPSTTWSRRWRPRRAIRPRWERRCISSTPIP